jgi:hypothetical protein
LCPPLSRRRVRHCTDAHIITYYVCWKLYTSCILHFLYYRNFLMTFFVFFLGHQYKFLRPFSYGSFFRASTPQNHNYKQIYQFFQNHLSQTHARMHPLLLHSNNITKVCLPPVFAYNRLNITQYDIIVSINLSNSICGKRQ